MDKIIQFETFSSLYNERLQKELQENEGFQSRFDLEIINLEDNINEFRKIYSWPEYSTLSSIRKIFFWIAMNFFLKKKYRYLKGGIVNIQFVSHIYLYLLLFLRNTFRKIVISFWGSDLLRQKLKTLQKMKLLFHIANWITVETDEMEQIFNTYTNNQYSKKIRKVRFGLTSISNIDHLKIEETRIFREKYGIPTNKKVVAVGYNRIIEQQHLLVFLSIIERHIPSEDIFILIPWTYGLEKNGYRNEIEQLLDGKYEYIFIDQFLTDQEIAAMRVISDILIQVQTTDSLSSTMLETLYAGNEVITGKWLPYGDLFKMGLKMHTVSHPSECGECLRHVLANPMTMSDRDKNHDLIGASFSWKANIENWISLYKD